MRNILKRGEVPRLIAADNPQQEQSGRKAPAFLPAVGWRFPTYARIVELIER